MYQEATSLPRRFLNKNQWNINKLESRRRERSITGEMASRPFFAGYEKFAGLDPRMLGLRKVMRRVDMCSCPSAGAAEFAYFA